MKNNIDSESIRQRWVFGSFKITFPDGSIMYYNAYTEVQYVLGKSIPDLVNDLVKQEEPLIKAHFGRDDLNIELGPNGAVEDLDDLPKVGWIKR